MNRGLALGLAAAWLAGSAGPARGRAPAVPAFGLGGFDQGEPIAIEAERLEARDGPGGRTVTFRDGVRVRQGALTLRADRLEAVYPGGAREPALLRAWGDVRVEEGSRRARCSEAHYQRVERALVCRGERVELRDGEDTLTGREIHFDLASHRVRVVGEPELAIHRPWLDEASAGEEELERLRGEGPVLVRSHALEADDADGRRTVRFSGDVHVRRGDVELLAETLEIEFPPAASQPERLIARGDVLVREGGREARCAHAEYRPGDRTIDCGGGARLRDGADRLESERLFLDLGARRVDATGGAVLRADPGARERERS